MKITDRQKEVLRIAGINVEDIEYSDSTMEMSKTADRIIRIDRNLTFTQWKDKWYPEIQPAGFREHYEEQVAPI